MNSNDYSVKELLQKFSDLSNVWHDEGRAENDGSAGNTLEDLLGVPENNLSLPDYGEVELKTKRMETGSLLTLFHKEPNPAASVPLLIKSLGWRHKNAGGKYPENEMSFRSTTQANRYSDRGFKVVLNDNRIEFTFNPSAVAVHKSDRTNAYSTYGDWLTDVNGRSPNYAEQMPLWYDRDLFIEKCIEKLDHALYAFCKTRSIVKVGIKVKQFKYVEAYLMKGFLPDKLETLFEKGALYIDFDARTNHNHGTKLRIKPSELSELFEHYKRVL